MMKKSCGMLLLGLVLAFPSTVSAQSETIVTKKSLDLLIDIGWGEAEILKTIQTKGTRFEISKADLAALKVAKVGPELIKFIETKVKAEVPKALTIADILKQWQEDPSEVLLRRLIVDAPELPKLTPQDALRLSGAKIPHHLIKLIRSPKKAISLKSPEKKLTTDDILKMTSMGVKAAVIRERIKTSDSHFSLTTADVLSLSKDGVDADVIQLMYQRSQEPETHIRTPKVEEMVVSSPEMAKAGATQELEIYLNSAAGFSMLVPKEFVKSTKYQPLKQIVQMVDHASPDPDLLPDLELSVMVVLLKPGDSDRVSASSLGRVAEHFSKGLKTRFEADGIQIKAQEPKPYWISSQSAYGMSTHARTNKEKRSYVGGNYILLSEGRKTKRLFVLSFSCRMEKEHLWRDVLISCIRSFTLDKKINQAKADPEVVAGDTPLRLFSNWRLALRRFDYASFHTLFDKAEDTPARRLSFVRLSEAIERDGKRIEIDKVIDDKTEIHFNIFGLDGPEANRLKYRQSEGQYRLVP